MALSKAETDQFDDLLQEIDERVALLGLAQVDEVERTVFSAVSAKANIDNGGFRRFFELSMPLADARDAFARLGLSGLESACREVGLLVFPEGEPADYKLRRPMLLAAWSPATEKCQDAVWECPMEAVEEAGFRYLERHQRLGKAGN